MQQVINSRYRQSFHSITMAKRKRGGRKAKKKTSSVRCRGYAKRKEPGVPKTWCTKRNSNPDKFNPMSFRTLCFDKNGRRVKGCSTNPKAVRGITTGCQKGHWKKKPYKKGYPCQKGYSEAQRILVKPGQPCCPRR